MLFWPRGTFDIASLSATYGAMLEESAQPALVVSTDGRVAAANAHALSWLAQPAKAVCGMPLARLPGLAGIPLAEGAGRLGGRDATTPPERAPEHPRSQRAAVPCATGPGRSPGRDGACGRWAGQCRAPFCW
ncbi:MAG: PAS domain-containing protein [Alkalilacustris sp.]